MLLPRAKSRSTTLATNTLHGRNLTSMKRKTAEPESSSPKPDEAQQSQQQPQRTSSPTGAASANYNNNFFYCYGSNSNRPINNLPSDSSSKICYFCTITSNNWFCSTSNILFCMSSNFNSNNSNGSHQIPTDARHAPNHTRSLSICSLKEKTGRQAGGSAIMKMIIVKYSAASYYCS